MNSFHFSENTMTIRQMPQNYILAHYKGEDHVGRHCVMSPDLSADPKLVVALTLTLLEYDNKYLNHPLDVIVNAEAILEKLQNISIKDIL